MTKRSHLYGGDNYYSPYPTAEEQVWKECDICGLKICVNNWPDHKSRTPKLFKFVICTDCDPRHPEDKWLQEGYRVLHPRRMRIVRMAQITRAVSFRPCFKDSALGCKCASCAAGKLFPPF